MSERVRYLREIGDYAEGMGIRIGIENEGGAYRDYVRLIESVNHDSIGATIDVGHCGFFTGVIRVDDLDARVDALNECISRLIQELGPKVFLLHTHNISKSDWRDHRSVPEGVIDFNRLFRECMAIDYQGGFDIELEESDREAKSRESGQFLDSLCRQFLCGRSSDVG